MGWADAPVVEDKPRPAAPQERWRAAPVASVGADIAASVPSALGRVPMVIAGGAGDLMGLGMETGRWIDENILGNPVKTREEVAAANPLAGLTSTALEQGWENATGVPMYDAQTKGGQVASSAMTGAGAGLILGGPTGAVVGGGGGGGGEYLRQKTEGTKWEMPASILGAIGGGAVGGAGVAGLRRMVTPRNVPAPNAAAARTLRQEGVRDLTEGQVTQGKALLAAERQRMGIRGDARRINQFEDLTAAALRRAGIEARRATPDVMDAAFNRFSQEFSALSARNTLTPDAELGTDLNSAWRYYAGRVNDNNRAPLIEGYMREMGNAMQANNGRIPGETYQSLRSRIQADARSMADPDAKRTLFDMAESLDAAMERSIGRTNPGDVGAFRDVRRRYRNILVVEDAVNRGSSEANLGLITGAALDGATRRIHGKRNYVRGQGDFADLSHAAGALMRELPLTGAAPLAPDTFFGAAKAGLGMVRMLPPVQRYLTNRMLPPPGGNPFTRSLLPAVPGATMATQGPYRTGGRF